MNSLSWFLYFVDVINGIATLSGFMIGGCIFLMFGLLMAVPVTDGDVLKEPFYWPWVKRTTACLFIAALLLVFIPSKNTLYAIAASEMGEKIAKSEAVQDITSDATKALHQWIKKQIEPETKK